MKMVAASDNMKSRGQDLLVLLLFPVFFILHESNRYPGLVPAGVQLKLLATYALVVLIMYLVALVIMNDRVKAFLTSICLILFYFFFGSYHDVARDVFTGSRLSSYSVVLPFWLFLLSISILLIRFSRRSFGRLHIFAKMLLAVLVLLETVILLAGLLSGGWKKNFLALEFPVNKTVMVADSLKPDIFYVVFDEHTSTRVLREQFGYDNSSLDAALRANGFYVAEQSTSNYNFTPFSLASTFSMDLLKLPAP
ncbi:MAG TPA: hypothetical protein VFZ78_04355, partial [Flavisolibacter sp.]